MTLDEQGWAAHVVGRTTATRYHSSRTPEQIRAAASSHVDHLAKEKQDQSFSWELLDVSTDEPRDEMREINLALRKLHESVARKLALAYHQLTPKGTAFGHG